MAINFSASIENYEGDRLRLRGSLPWELHVIYIYVYTYTCIHDRILKYNSFKMKSNLPTENCDCPVTSGHARNIHFICKVSRNVTSGYLFKKKCITKTLMSDYSPNAYFKVICGTIAHVYMWFCEFSFFVFFFSCKFEVKRSIYSIFCFRIRVRIV